MDFSETCPLGIDKIDRYDWKILDSPGTLVWINKNEIKIEEAYQRSLLKERVQAMSAKWSWIACGTLLIAQRAGELWAIDGQHRLAASKRRSDITKLPCILFETESVQQEAEGFLFANIERKPMSIMQRHKAMVVSGDSIANKVQDKLTELGLSGTIDKKSPNHFKSYAWAMAQARENFDQFSVVLTTAVNLSKRESEPVQRILLTGLAYINKYHPGGLNEPKLAERIKVKGAFNLTLAAKKSAVLAGGGGGRVYAKGMIDELNKGLSRKFYIKGISD
jgi:hypothetical protein